MRRPTRAATEIFVCDNCGTRSRLNSAVRHWCPNCTVGKPVEMRSVRDKRKQVSDDDSKHVPRAHHRHH